MGKYCCFFCPSDNYEERKLEDKCPTCERTFGFPLTSPPNEVGEYSIIKPLGRGFYASTYIAEKTGPLKIKVVLKVTPSSFYEHFSGKDFEAECQKHLEVCQGTEHLVKISGMKVGCEVKFGVDSLVCDIAELEYIEGNLLEDYLNGKEVTTARIAAQIAIDLLRLREELEAKLVFHDDLHPGNIIIQKLPQENYRPANAIEPTIRAVAIDLGSVTNESKSDGGATRLGDVHQIGEHIRSLAGQLLSDPDKISDFDYRLASSLQNIFHLFAGKIENQRLPLARELIENIEMVAHALPRHPWRPWKEQLTLRTFGSFYNAQTLNAWHVPQLLVDPEGAWLHQISSPGPQIITGMRGCGKTMLLRALQFHARASIGPTEQEGKMLSRLEEDQFIGLFVSAKRLLDSAGLTIDDGEESFTRLFLVYAHEAVRAVMHLQDIRPDIVSAAPHQILTDLIVQTIPGTAELLDSLDLDDLNFKLEKTLALQESGQIKQPTLLNPGPAFEGLAKAIQNCSQMWTSSNVLFLLDDVSTRHFDAKRIKRLLSVLLFQSPVCAFKMTSEVQTMELELVTPGENLLAREGRDMAVFDLGSEVYDRIKGTGAKTFVDKILQQRADCLPGHPGVKPSQLLGNETLKTITDEITGSSTTSNRRKAVYRGITALSNVCVGDIGDVISLYERILKQDKGIYPIPAKVQTKCFLDHCSNRLYDLDRRAGELKDYAKSFAEASYELMMKSYKQGKGEKSPRIRQYTAIYVRVTLGDVESQKEQLRDLIDAGVFVFTGGSARTKTKDSDPTLQFKLSFRKIYGLTNYISLSDRDRFELSGKDLEDWLSNPAGGKEILLRNLGGGLNDNDYEEGIEEEIETSESSPNKTPPEDFLDQLIQDPTAPQEIKDEDPFLQKGIEEKLAITELKRNEVVKRKPSLIVLALGFEERTLKSAERLVKLFPAIDVLAVKYKEPGNTEKILKLFKKSGSKIEVFPYEDFNKSKLLPKSTLTLVDVTGLAKPIIFGVVRNCLRKSSSVIIVHTQAESYYPANSDLKGLLAAQRVDNRSLFFDELAQVFMGELPPYKCFPLLETDADRTRKRIIYAFSSPKHQRLLTLFDDEEFDRYEIIAPEGETSRNRVAKHLADIASTDHAESNVSYVDTNDLVKTLELLQSGFKKWYILNGFNFEIGLTGSKMETVAAAALGSIYKVTQCWYVKPDKFDRKKFTKGFGETNYFLIEKISK